MRHIVIALIIGFSSIGFGEDSAPKSKLFIKKCSSGIDYPDKGDESVDETYGDKIYHIRIFHPKVVEGPHFSSPFFWISDKDNKELIRSFLTVRSHVDALSWHRINGYFFAEKEGDLRGFFIEDGFDNADNRSSGLVFLHDGEKSYAWRWVFNKWPYRVMDANDDSKAAPEELVKRIAEVMDRVREEANSWPGP